MSQHKHNTILNKVTISYFLLVLLSAAAIGVLYKGINNIVSLDANSTKPNQKLKFINKILTQVYEAESFSRSYFLFRDDSILKIYIKSNENIAHGIDSLKKMCVGNQKQTKTLEEIISLINQKKSVIQQLLEINPGNEQEMLYARVLDEVYYNTFDEVTQPSLVRQNVTTKRDSVYEVKEKSGLFNKMKKIFGSNPPPNEKTLTKTSIEEEVTYDTIPGSNISAEQIQEAVKDALHNFKARSELLKKQYISKETELLHNDRIILDRIRNIISSLETEEILNTTILLSKSQEILNKANNSVIMLGGFAVLLVLVFFIIIFRDISRSKAYQAELQKTQKYSEDLLQMKEQFVANMSHEIRTPLSAIIGFAEQLKKTNPNSDQELIINTIEQSSKHLHSLINNVLDISKSNAGRLTLDKVSFKLNELIIETFQTFSHEASKKGLKFNYHCNAGTEIALAGDKLKVKQILINIVGNAVKFTSSGMVDIVADIKELNKEKVEAEVIIFDTGIGIPPEKLDTIFEEFSQADADITRKFGGSGLGLSISKRFVDLMEGTIKVDSHLNKGSTFIINIPFLKCNKAECSENKEITFSNKFNDLHLLLVEDDETMRLLMMHIFNTHNIRFEFATTGNEAIEKLKENKFNLVLSDIQMPGMSGMELVRIIRQEFDNQLPVIAFTAHSSISEETKSAGFNDFLAKPFTEKDLLLKISNTLGINLISNNLASSANDITISDNANGYSLTSLKEFVGNDPDSINSIISSFLINTDKDLGLLRVCIKNNNIEEISEKIHKLLPMFRQLQIETLIDEMQMIERYKELGLSSEDVILFTENFILSARKIMKNLKKEIPTEQFPAV